MVWVGVVVVAVGVAVGMGLVAWGLRRRAARRARGLRTLVYDLEAEAWVPAGRRAPRVKW